jgi:CheY-like chemotaxis protein
MALPASALRILVVDDSATSCAVIKQQLLGMGCYVVIANDGQKALTYVQDARFDLVLLDCYMPGMDGFSVVRSIRQQEQRNGSAHLPVIGISGDTDEAHSQLCLDSGMDGLLGKPLPAGELQTILALWCCAGQHTVDMANLATVDLPALFRDTSHEDYALLMQAVNAGDLAHAKRLVHRMKGAALTMKADGMVAVLKRIDMALAATKLPESLLQEDMQMLLQQIDAV